MHRKRQKQQEVYTSGTGACQEEKGQLVGAVVIAVCFCVAHLRACVCVCRKGRRGGGGGDTDCTHRVHCTGDAGLSLPRTHFLLQKITTNTNTDQMTLLNMYRCRPRVVLQYSRVSRHSGLPLGIGANVRLLCATRPSKLVFCREVLATGIRRSCGNRNLHILRCARAASHGE